MKRTGTKWVELPDKAWKPELVNHWQPLLKVDNMVWRKFVTQVGEDTFHWECGIGDVHRVPLLVTNGTSIWIENDCLACSAESLAKMHWMPLPLLPDGSQVRKEDCYDEYYA